MVYLIHRPRPRVKLSRREVFIRDGYTCQYCGRQCHDLTIDHVVPRSRGGMHSWDNLVSACKPCNHRKGGKLPAEARMSLRKEPREPRAGRYYTIERRIEGAVTHQWSKFLPGFTPISVAARERARGESRGALTSVLRAKRNADAAPRPSGALSCARGRVTPDLKEPQCSICD